MKKNILNHLFFFYLAFIGSMTAAAQFNTTRMLTFIAGNEQIDRAAVYEFYSRLHYQAAWFQKDNTRNRNLLLTLLKQAPAIGLQENDYQFFFISSFRRNEYLLINEEDSLEAEIRLTDAALHFYRDLTYGNTAPVFGYDGLRYTPSCLNIPSLLAEYISKNSLQSLLSVLRGSLPEILALENKLRWLHKVTAEDGFQESKLASGKPDAANTTLITKLYQHGMIESIQVDFPDSILNKKIREAQIQFNLEPDGIIGINTLRELNVPLSTRIKQLNRSLNYYRWLNCLVKKQEVITLNIPAAYLKVYQHSKVILEMRMIVGKRTTPTPTLTSKVDEVILYPYWHVPFSIATKELLPRIKRNTGYLNTGNYQVLSKSGKIMDPNDINWNALSRTNFPYIIRQSTGCDNALGLLKLNFKNPFSVYLHDTNSKNLFEYKRRYYSHGCMRMEKPMELGQLLLQNNRVAIDTLEQKGCLRNLSPITVPAELQMPVVIWYNPAGIDSTGRVVFYEDIYRKFS